MSGAFKPQLAAPPLTVGRRFGIIRGGEDDDAKRVGGKSPPEARKNAPLPRRIQF